MPDINQEQQIEYQKAYYQANRELAKEQRANRRRRNRLFVAMILEKSKCADCELNDSRVLEFDHVVGTKSKSVSYMIAKAYSIESIKKEIDKCEVVCANCHRIRTYDRLTNCGRNSTLQDILESMNL